MPTISVPSSALSQFPLPPEGVHEVSVVRALYKLQENKFDVDKGLQPTVSLMMESTKTYKDDVTDEEKHHMIWKTMKISDNDASNMYEFFHSVVGIDVPVDANQQISFDSKVEDSKDGEDKVHLTQFEDLTFSIVVKHEKSKETGKMKYKVDSWFATDEQKSFNAKLFSSPSAEADEEEDEGFPPSEKTIKEHRKKDASMRKV